MSSFSSPNDRLPAWFLNKTLYTNELTSWNCNDKETAPAHAPRTGNASLECDMPVSTVHFLKQLIRAQDFISVQISKCTVRTGGFIGLKLHDLCDYEILNVPILVNQADFLANGKV